MARNALDLRLLFSVLAGYDAEDPFSVPVPLRPPELRPLRIGLWEQFYSAPVDPEIRAAMRRAAALLAGPGREVVEFVPYGLERAPNIWAFLFADWTAPVTRLLIEGREAEAHWTLIESLMPSSPAARTCC